MGAVLVVGFCHFLYMMCEHMNTTVLTVTLGSSENAFCGNTAIIILKLGGKSTRNMRKSGTNI